MPPIAYGLREAFAGTTTDDDGEAVPIFTGGVLTVHDGDREVNVRQLLDEGDGVIVVDGSDWPLVSRLDEYPALKRVAVPGDAPQVVDRYANVKRADLDARAGELGVAVESGTKIDELRAGLALADASLADGVLVHSITAEGSIVLDDPENPGHPLPAPDPEVAG